MVFVPTPMTTAAYPMTSGANGVKPIVANSPATAGLVLQQNKIEAASKMQGKSGGKSRKGGAKKNRAKSMARRSSRRKMWQKWIKSRKMRKYKGGGATIVVPYVKPLYTEVGGNQQTVGAGVTNLTKLSAGIAENSKFDTCGGSGANCTTAVKAQN